MKAVNRAESFEFNGFHDTAVRENSGSTIDDKIDDYGDQYRLVSPYEGNHCAINYVSKDKQRAVLFAYDLHPRYKEPVMNVKITQQWGFGYGLSYTTYKYSNLKVSRFGNFTPNRYRHGSGS